MAHAPPEPMEARLVEALPEDAGWQFEPKWDGFRALVVRNGGDIQLWSKSGKPLGRYFPEVVAAIAATVERRATLDGELILPIGHVLSFDALQARLHPAASRIERLSRETPAQLMLFDCLRIGDRDLAAAPLTERRAALEQWHGENASSSLLLSPASDGAAQATAWLAASGGALDGVVAKRLDAPYRFGERAMLKVKQHRTADCVVGGFRTVTGSDAVASLLLGLYDDAGKLNHVGFVSGFPAPSAVCSSNDWRRTSAEPASPARHPAARAAGTPARRAHGSRSAPSWWSRCATIRSPASASVTGPSCCAGGPTRRRGNAPWSS